MAKLEVTGLHMSYCAPPHGRKGKRNWLWELQSYCPVTWNMLLFIQSRVKIAILLIKASHQKFHVAEYNKNKLKWPMPFLISLCALCFQSTCKHNGNHGIECVQKARQKSELCHKTQNLQHKEKWSVFILHLMDYHNEHLIQWMPNSTTTTEMFKSKGHKSFLYSWNPKAGFSLVLTVYAVDVHAINLIMVTPVLQ